MANIQALCPLCKRACVDCSIYRGRHYNLSFCARYRRTYSANKRAGKASIPADPVTVFKELKEALEPWDGNSRELKHEQIRMKVIDMEMDTIREIDISEAKDWDWDNPLIIRMIDGQHVKSWDMLVKMCNYKYENSSGAIELHEGPRFMLLGGG